MSNEVILIAYPDQSEQEYLELKVGYNKDFNMNNLYIDNQAHSQTSTILMLILTVHIDKFY